MKSSTGTFHRDCVLMSFCECRRHYSSWGVSRESQSSPLRFFVESNATDHQEVSSFFSDKNPKNPSLLDFERATWSLEVVSPANRLPWPIYFIIIICIIYSCPQCWIRKIGLFQATRITWLSLIGLEEPSLTISHSLELLRSNSGPNPNCRRYKIGHFICAI